MTIKNVILEIGTEEIPSRFLPDILGVLEKTAREDFAGARIAFKSLSVFATPRRIALIIRDAEEKQSDLVSTFRGPAWNAAFDANGNPTRAAHGFAKSRGVTVEQLTPFDADGVRYTCAEVSEPGSPTLKILPELFPSLIRKLDHRHRPADQPFAGGKHPCRHWCRGAGLLRRHRADCIYGKYRHVDRLAAKPL